MRIIKRKRGTETYLYLQSSVRRDGKVITRELYLGKNLPKDLDKYKERLEKETGNDINEKLERIRDNFQKDWKKHPKSAKEKDLEAIAVAFTYNTNAIEGSKITLSETMDILENGNAPNKPIKDIKETENHKKVFFEMLGEKTPLSEKLVLKWHAGLFKDTKPDIAGVFRNYGVSVGTYLAPEWWKVPKLMREMINFSVKNVFNPVELAARVHYRFEKIHPFGDGNGRVGRLIMNYILWKSDYPMLIIEYKKRQAYYKALSTEEGFTRYFFKLYLSTHKSRYLQ